MSDLEERLRKIAAHERETHVRDTSDREVGLDVYEESAPFCGECDEDWPCEHTTWADIFTEAADALSTARSEVESLTATKKQHAKAEHEWQRIWARQREDLSTAREALTGIKALADTDPDQCHIVYVKPILSQALNPLSTDERSEQ